MRQKIKLVTFLLILIFAAGCNNPGEEEGDYLAYITASQDSEYENTIRDLNLGVLFDFNIELPYAEETMVTLWVQGYKNGEELEADELANIRFGNFPEEEVEGRLGFSLLNPDNQTFFLYTPGGTAGPHIPENNPVITDENTFSTWEYAIGDERLDLSEGEARVLAAFRQTKGESTRSGYDYNSPGGLREAINDDDVVLLLMIEVKREEF
ncbi:hypothetical protein MM300_21770 [Evansella sp. LMS18]|uniref:hypothetical protein n=1 Tax=Evansella sp. LMS18 TaxID=2924033 RepID=UPI0020D181A9|nr:hypothetical protein [Evansella sp. LMS18]UTR10463.1 hypothetical protein MM300_21770 [Evansella sp. LMS18]